MALSSKKTKTDLSFEGYVYTNIAQGTQLSNLVVYIKSILKNLSIQITQKKSMRCIFVYTNKKEVVVQYSEYLYIQKIKIWEEGVGVTQKS